MYDLEKYISIFIFIYTYIYIYLKYTENAILISQYSCNHLHISDSQTNQSTFIPNVSALHRIHFAHILCKNLMSLNKNNKIIIHTQINYTC